MSESCADALMAKPTPQEAFALMLHDRLIAAEGCVAEIQRGLTGQPGDGLRLWIRSAPRRWFFAFKAYRDLWPAAEDPSGLEDKAQALFDAMGPYAMHASLVMSQEKTGNTRHATKLNEIVTGGRGPASDAVVREVFARPFVVVEGVITTDEHGCDCTVVGRAIEKAWRFSWVGDEWKDMFRHKWHARLADVMVLIGMDHPTMQQLKCPDAWHDMLTASSRTKYDIGLLGESGEMLVQARCTRPSPLEEARHRNRVAVSLDSRVKVQNVAVRELIEELYDE